jgi:hypothetical protein
MSLQTRRIAARVMAVPLLSAALVMSSMCGESSTGPSPTSRVLRGVELRGPATVAPGESVQFTLEVVYSDGSRGGPSTPVTWRSSHPSVLSTDENGLARGLQNGRATLSAQLGNRNGTREINVVPSGTFWIDGSVTEAGAPSFTLSNATVTVISGTGAGARALSGADGRFSLFGVAGPLQIRFERDGYVTRDLDVVVNEPRTVNSELELKEPRPSFSGSFTLAIVAAAECHPSLPESVWERRYAAQLRQDGPNVFGTLSGASFATVFGTIQNSFHGRLVADRFEMVMGPWDSYYYGTPGLVETMSDGLFYAPYVFSNLTGTSTEFRGSFTGYIYVLRSVDRFEVASWCHSSGHQVVLSR